MPQKELFVSDSKIILTIYNQTPYIAILDNKFYMKEFIKKTPILNSVAKFIYFSFIAPFKSFPGSEDYWKNRYLAGDNSGAGSYHKLAEFKSEILNSFIIDQKIETIIEYGCGDGNQLKSLNYPSYIGFDISLEAIALCENTFSHDDSKTFKLMSAYAGEKSQLTLSLDVIYHLIEDEVFSTYMKRLFDSAESFVILYSSNTDQQAKLQASHVKHRKFSTWIENNRPEWKLSQHVPNKYPLTSDDKEGSFADFYIYKNLSDLN